VFAAAAVTTQIRAENSPEQSARAYQLLSEVVVTATRSETERWKTASSITVIDRKHFEDRQQRMMTDVLREVPGLTIADRGTAGSAPGLFLRGMNSDQTLVVLNGRPIPANLAGTFNLETFSLDSVERVEVLRGPSASVYGGRTLGGVINILTRSGRNLSKPEYQAFWETGSFGTNREGVSARGDSGLLDWSLEYNRSDTQGYRVNSQMQLDNASGLLGLDITDAVRLEVDFRYYNAQVGVPGRTEPFTPGGDFSALKPNDPDNHFLTEFWSISPRLIWKTSESWTQTVTMQFGKLRQVASNFPYSPPTFDVGLNNRLGVQSQYWEYQSVLKPSEKLTFTSGFSAQDQYYYRISDVQLPRTRDISQSETNWAVFEQLGLELAKDLHFTGGLRHDTYSDFVDATSWRSGVSWKIPRFMTLLHTSYGTAFAAASPQNRETALFGNPFLTNLEESKGFELGFEQPLADDTLTFSCTAFRNEIRNLIQYDFVQQKLFTIGEALTKGVEACLRWEPCAAFGLQGSYTYLDAENLTNAARLVRRPRHQVSGDLWVRPIDRLRVGCGILCVVDREDFFYNGQLDSEDYARVRATASFSLSKHSEIFARVENLLAERYAEVPGFPAPRTGVYGGLKIKF
jgi:vitamin B12 transporter